MLLDDGESRGVIDSGILEHDGEGGGTGDSDDGCEDQSCRAEGLRFENAEGGQTVQRASGCSADGGDGQAMGARQCNGGVGEEVEDETHAGEDAGFVAEAIAQELEGFFAIAGAEAGWVETEEQGEDFLRHNPPGRFCVRERGGGGRRVDRLRCGRACGHWR